MDAVERRITAASHYVLRGWKLFTVQDNKRPWANCGECTPGAHDGETCPHPFCHAFQAATGDLEEIVKRLVWRPGGLLAVRTGAPSGLVVVDAEGTDRVGYGCTGVEYLDSMDWWGDTLRARTSSGGVHMFYKHPGGVTSRNRVLPNIDIKADGGYVLLPPAAGRAWINWTPKAGIPDAPDPECLAWLENVKTPGVGNGTSAGKSRGRKAPLPGETVPAGVRYEFTRDLVYRLRKEGKIWQEAVETCRTWYEAYDQPPVAQYLLPWRQVEYELERAWKRVEPEPELPDGMLRWMASRKEAS